MHSKPTPHTHGMNPQTSKLMFNSHAEVVLGTHDDIRRSERPSESARIPILTVRIFVFSIHLGLRSYLAIRTGAPATMAPYHTDEANR